MRSTNSVQTQCRFIVPLLFVIGLCVAAASAIEGAPRSELVQQESPAATLEGTWRVEITLVNCQTGEQLRDPFPALATFARGGTVTTSDGGLSPTVRGAGHGDWWRTQGRTFAAIAEAFLFTPTGALSGRQRLVQQIELDAGGMDFEATVSSTILNTFGQVVAVGCARSVGRRLD